MEKSVDNVEKFRFSTGKTAKYLVSTVCKSMHKFLHILPDNEKYNVLRYRRKMETKGKNSAKKFQITHFPLSEKIFFRQSVKKFVKNRQNLGCIIRRQAEIMILSTECFVSGGISCQER